MRYRTTKPMRVSGRHAHRAPEPAASREINAPPSPEIRTDYTDAEWRYIQERLPLWFRNLDPILLIMVFLGGTTLGSWLSSGVYWPAAFSECVSLARIFGG